MPASIIQKKYNTKVTARCSSYMTKFNAKFNEISDLNNNASNASTETLQQHVKNGQRIMNFMVKLHAEIRTMSRVPSRFLVFEKVLSDEHRRSQEIISQCRAISRAEKAAIKASGCSVLAN
ncbi:hypothetical protein ENVG_00211 [Emiliania huxleyi virus 84]|nr:hypothetical protein ENVG_00211 [Emiliania huxleyi virus 84]AEP15363.1 hypothetical protein EOVG_00426 [Emiliania huxleyi virus 88]